MLKYILLLLSFFILFPICCFAREDAIPLRSPDAGSDPYTIISFLYLWPGRTISEQDLGREIALARHRLMQSGYFYRASIDIIPPQEFPDRRSILVKVSDGFVLRFGGDNLYAYFGMENYLGEDKSFRVFAGYNKCGGYFLDRAFLRSNIILGVKAFYRNSGIGIPESDFYEQMEGGLTLGVRPHPDWRLDLETVFRETWSPSGVRGLKGRELLLIGTGIMYNFPRSRFCRGFKKVYRFGAWALVYGLLAGLSFCPPFFAAATRVYGGGDAISGIVYFFFFFLGTSVFFLPLFGVHLIRKYAAHVRSVARSVVLLMGIYFFLFLGILDAL